MPGPAATHRQKATVSLRVVVVGGSISGLSTAYALQHGGHDVVVVEQSDGKARSLGGLRSPPNMTRVLNNWGLEPQLVKYGLKCNKFAFSKGDTGELIGFMKLHDEFLRDLLADFVLIQHGDLHSMLLDLCLREGVKVRYNSKVVSVTSEPPSVTLESGETLYSDMILGADGPNSLVRSVGLDEELEASGTQLLCVTYTVPTQAMRRVPELVHFCDVSDWSVWLGDNWMIRASLVHESSQYSMTLSMPHAITPKQSLALGEHWQWDNNRTLEEFGVSRNLFEPRLLKLMDLASNVTATAYKSRPLLDSLVCGRGRVSVIGESAHPLEPNAMHSAALVIEDAEVLGSLFSRIHHVDEISRLMSAYEELRLGRGNSTRVYEKKKLEMLCMPKGPIQAARDAKLAEGTYYETWDHMDETSFREMWGDEMEMFAYNATEVVEDWWTKWGAFITRPRGDSISNPTPPTPTVRVSVSQDAEDRLAA